MFKRSIFGVLVILTVLLTGPGCTLLMPEMSYQGQLTDAYGNPVPNGTYPMTFRLYDEVDDTVGDALWSETQPVLVSSGAFNVDIGTTGYITPTIFAQTLWLGIEVGTDGEMTPRQQLTGAPYAMSLVPGSAIYGWVENTVEYPGALNVANVGSGYGIAVNALGDAGVYITGDDEGTVRGDVGVMVEDVDAGAVITVTDGIGVNVQSQRDYGTRSVSVNEDGVFAWCELGGHAFDTGLTGGSLQGIGVYGYTQGDSYGLYTNDDLYVGGNIVTTSPLRYISRNGSDITLSPGTAVSALGVHMLEGTNVPVMDVKQTATGDTVLGVVTGRIEIFTVEEGQEDIDPGIHFGQVEGKAAPGDYMVIVIQGLTQVRSSDNALKVGETIYALNGRASSISTTSAIGLAMSEIDDDGMVWVLVGLD